MYGSTTSMSTSDAMAALRKKGCVKAIVHFSGGNDEGGADGFTFLTADGTKIEMDMRTEAHQDWDTKKWVVYTWEGREQKSRPATDVEIEDARLREVLEQPIYDQYGSFAGEFYVSGECTWDVATGKAEMHGHYEYTTGEDF